MIDCLFVTPPLDGPETGGTLFNRQLIAAVAAAAPTLTLGQCSWEQLDSAPVGSQLWVDSLYLEQLPKLQHSRVGLLLHYLPSLLTKPLLRSAAELTPVEQRALTAADVIVTPGHYLQQLVTEICPGKLCVCVPPGVEGVRSLGGALERDGSVLMICNVTANKGVLPFLHALTSLEHKPLFHLAIAGDLQMEASYAQQCLALCRGDERVEFLGSVPPSEVLERLARASLFVSSSTMESYGMALAEARALGTPILALPGGNIARHVAAESGGALLPDATSLAAAVCALISDPRELAARQTLARKHATARAWSTAAADFLQAMRALGNAYIKPTHGTTARWLPPSG